MGIALTCTPSACVIEQHINAAFPFNNGFDNFLEIGVVCDIEPKPLDVRVLEAFHRLKATGDRIDLAAFGSEFLTSICRRVRRRNIRT